MKFQAIKGTKDILPGETYIWQKFEQISRAVFNLYGYREIRTPIIEETELFVKTVGKDTDIVKKEMFSFMDRGERNISLRPEGTAPVIRAYLENNLDKTDQFQKLYYIGPMFRAERPQAGRFRQFHQIGVEAIGSTNPAVDAEVIEVFTRILDSNGIKNYTLKINNLGCREDKKNLSKNLKEIFNNFGRKAVSGLLCDDCERRLKDNPIRVLDCKNANCRAVVRGHVKKIAFLCQDCKDHFAQVLKFLNSVGIKYKEDPYIVRGIDYYTRTVFEATHQDLGAQDAIGAGGRYDNLVSDMGGPKTGAVGFALGVERLLLVSKKDVTNASHAPNDLVYIATIGKNAYEKAFLLVDEFRKNSICCEMDYEDKSLKSQMRVADRLKAKIVLIIGEDEIAKGEATLRDMETKEQISVRFEDLASKVKERVA